MNFSPIDNSRPIASECTLMKAEGMPKAEYNVFFNSSYKNETFYQC